MAASFSHLMAIATGIGARAPRSATNRHFGLPARADREIEHDGNLGVAKEGQRAAREKVRSITGVVVLYARRNRPPRPPPGSIS